VSEVITTSSLHHAIMESFIDNGHAPTSEDLATQLGTSQSTIHQALSTLQDEHGVVLHPHTPEVWVAHPFSSAPTPFVVKHASKEWWAPCAWCALGVAAVVDADVEIVTTLGATSSQATLRIENGRLQDPDHVVHFPVPMRHAWDNVLYTCSTMLLFRTEADVDAWSERHRIPRGDVQPVELVWELAQAWYGRHRARDWRKWTAEEARDIFQRLGLTGPIWEVPGADERF